MSDVYSELESLKYKKKLIFLIKENLLNSIRMALKFIK